MKYLSFVFLVSFTLVQFSNGQEELKEELEESLFEMVEQLEERKSFHDELEENLQSLLDDKISEDEIEEDMLQAEIEGNEEWIERNTNHIEKLRLIIDSDDLDPEQKESSFANGMKRLRRINHLHELEFASHRMEVELELHVEKNEEETVDRLERRLDNLNLRIERTQEIHAEWDQVAAARKSEQYEKAEKLSQALWLRERDLELGIQLDDINMEVAETKGQSAELKAESKRVEKILNLTIERQKQTQRMAEKWAILKEKLKASDMHQKHELIENFDRAEEKFHLTNEVLNIRKNLLFAESEGNLDEIEELQANIEELEQEIKGIN